jgi:hypothetical protein
MLFVLVSLYNAQSFVNEINQFVFYQKKIIVLVFFSLLSSEAKILSPRLGDKVDSVIGLTQQVLRNFFSNFGLIFQYVSPLDPCI